jgi:hypothetical protein
MNLDSQVVGTQGYITLHLLPSLTPRLVVAVNADGRQKLPVGYEVKRTEFGNN